MEIARLRRLAVLVITLGVAAGALAIPGLASGAQVKFLKHCDSAPRCGTLKVDLDRSSPGGRKIPIFFELYKHRNSGPTDQALFATGGGPGFSITQDFLSTHLKNQFATLRDTRDLVFIDQRGVGRSKAIDCPDVQHGTDDVAQDLAACGAQLGDSSSLYGSADVAQDIDELREALGIEDIDFYGGSYAGMDIQAYAVRYPEHLRSAVLDAPVTANELDIYGRPVLDAMTRGIDLLCERSQSCSDARPEAMASVADLAEHLRSTPVDGTGRDYTGAAHDVHVTEAYLLWRIMGNTDGGYIAPSELGAAGDALDEGDEAPLLRLAAESDGDLFPDEGSPKHFSAGLNNARYCTDFQHAFPWDVSEPLGNREDDWGEAIFAIPESDFEPFDKDAWFSPFPIAFSPDPCIYWPDPGHSVEAPVPDSGDLPGGVPTLITAGDLDFDTPTGEIQDLAAAWPNSEFFEMANGSHVSLVSERFRCASQIIVEFIDQLALGDTDCADDLEPLEFPAVGQFPVTADQADEATTAGGGDASTDTDRQVAAVVAGTATDSMRRIFAADGSGRGLRGGKFQGSYGPESYKGELKNVRFAEDVTVNGTIKYPYAPEILTSKVDVDGPGSEDGTLKVQGLWFAFEHDAEELSVTGTLDGRTINVTVPAT